MERQGQSFRRHLSRHILVVSIGAALLAFTAVAAGCGGDDRGDSSLSKEEFIAQADAICAEQQEQLDALPALEVPAREAEYIAIAEKTVDDLRSLAPPADDVAAIDEILSGFEHVVAASKDRLAAMRAEDTKSADAAGDEAVLALAAAVSAAGQYGFTTCTRFAQ